MEDNKATFIGSSTQEEDKDPKRKRSSSKKRKKKTTDPKQMLVEALLSKEGISYADWLDRQHDSVIFKPENIEKATAALTTTIEGGDN